LLGILKTLQSKILGMLINNHLRERKNKLCIKNNVDPKKHSIWRICQATLKYNKSTLNIIAQIVLKWHF